MKVVLRVIQVVVAVVIFGVFIWGAGFAWGIVLGTIGVAVVAWQSRLATRRYERYLQRTGHRP